MAQIPLGNFDQVRGPAPVLTGAPDLGASLAAPGRALEQLGQQGAAIADHALAANRAAQDQAAEMDKALKRVKIVNAAAEVEIQTNQAATDTEDDVRTGRATWANAAEGFQTRLSHIEAPKIDGLDPVQTEQYDGIIRQHRLVANSKIDGVVRAAKVDDGQAQWGQTVVTFDRLANDKNTTPEKRDSIVATVRAMIPSFRQFGLTQDWLDKQVQDFSDKVYTNDAYARKIAAGDNLDAIATLRHDLTDPAGYFAKKLDSDRLVAIDSSLAGEARAIEARNNSHADRLEATQDRTLTAIDAQIASGYPSTVEQRTSWAGAFPPGSPRRAEFEARVQGEAEVQTFLRKPIAEQLGGLAAEQSQMLASGADPHQQANFARKKAAVTANVKMLTEQPQLFAATHMATPVEPIEINDLADPAKAGKIAAILQKRAATNAVLRKQFGPQVKDVLLLPNEAAALTTVLDKMAAPAAAATFGKLYATAGSESNYEAVMAQLAPDNPVLAQAGRLSAAQRLYSPDNPSDKTSLISKNVAETMLRGDGLLNATKGDKATDGNPKAYPMPPDKDLRGEFSKAVGNAYAGDGARFERDYQFIRAYYAGRSAETGKISEKLVDKDVAAQAVVAVLGNMVDVNGRKVAAPWGMDDKTFTKNWQTAATAALPGVDATSVRNILHGGQLLQLPDGSYALAQGRALVLGKDGKTPVTFRVPRQ